MLYITITIIVTIIVAVIVNLSEKKSVDYHFTNDQRNNRFLKKDLLIVNG